jgi:hypothetical protein
LYKSGTSSWFVYIPSTQGLQIFLGRTAVPFSISAWSLIGDISLLGRSLRDSRVVAEQPVKLLMIPKEIYLKYWYQPCGIKKFTAHCRSWKIHQQLGI